MRASFDPGQAWGICLWVRGYPVELHTVWAKGESFEERRRSVWDQLESYLQNAELRYQEKLALFVIEAFQVGYNKNTAQTRKCENLKGYVIYGLENWFDPPQPVLEISKGSAKKTEAAWLAKQFGLTGTEHAKDALHLGCLAGWRDAREII